MDGEEPLSDSGPPAALESPRLIKWTQCVPDAIAAPETRRLGGSCRLVVAAIEELAMIRLSGRVAGGVIIGIVAGAVLTAPILSLAADATWQSGRALPKPRTQAGAVTAPCRGALSVTCIYVVGGIQSIATSGIALKSLEMFNPKTRKWTSEAKLKSARAEEAVAAAPCPLAVKVTCVYALTGASGGTALSSESYDPATDKWAYIPNLPASGLDDLESATATAAPCTTNLAVNCLYLVGGYSMHIGEATNRFYMFNPLLDTWTQFSFGPSSAREGQGIATAACEGSLSRTCIYVIAGDQAPNSTGAFDIASVEMFDPSLYASQMYWQPAQSLPSKTTDLAATVAPCVAAAGTCIYAVGGSVKGKSVGTTEMFNPSTNSWAPLLSLTAAREYLGAVTARCSDKYSATCVYAIGGEDLSGRPPLATVEMMRVRG
jgi:hypothetical protein